MKNLIFIAATLVSFSSFAFRTVLSADELAKLKKGEEVVRVENLKGQVFPRVTLINVIANSPKENMDVFTDFENHKNFIPNLVKSKVIKKSGNETDVAFEMHMPMPVSNSEYSTKHIVEQMGEDYKLTWDLIESKQIKASKGTVMFEKYDDGKSLFTYINHITPDSKLAWVVKDKVVPDIQKNIKVIIKHLAETIAKKK